MMGDFEQERSRLYTHGGNLAGTDENRERLFSWYIR
jgi:hypothetical protein